MRALLVAALVLPLAGCAAPPQCGPSDHAQWMELGLYETLAGRGSEHATSASLGDGSFVFPNSTVFGADWSPSSGGHAFIVALPVAAATLTLSGGAWDLTFQLPSREWTNGAVTLRADPRGVAMAFVEGENHTASLQETDDLLRQLGLPPSG